MDDYKEVEQDQEQNKMDKFEITIIIIMLLILFGVVIFFLEGCTKTALKRIVVDPNGLVSYTAFTNYECMMKSSMQEAEVMIEDGQGYRHYAIGSREQWPDPNTVEAVGGAAGKLIKEVAR